MNRIGRCPARAMGGALFLVVCLVASTALRLTVRKWHLELPWEVGWIAMAAGAAGCAWLVWRWRHAHPLWCATILGIFGAIGGAGLVTLLLHLMIHILAP